MASSASALFWRINAARSKRTYFRVESKRLVDEADDGNRCPITHLHDHLGHAHALAHEALESMALRVIDHAGDLRTGQSVQGVVRSEAVAGNSERFGSGQ